MRAIHLKMKDIVCDQCEYTTSLRQNLKNHIMVSHSNTSYTFTCKRCKYRTNSKSSLGNHEKAVHLKIKDHRCMHCNFQTAYPSLLKSHEKKCKVFKKELSKNVEYKECFIKLVPLDPSLLVEAFTPSPNEMGKEEKSIGTISDAAARSLKEAVLKDVKMNKGEAVALSEAVARSLKDEVFKEVKKKIGEAVALYIFDQWWAKEEAQYKAAQEELTPEKFREESSRRCHLCKYQAESEDRLTEHLMMNHVLDLGK